MIAISARLSQIHPKVYTNKKSKIAATIRWMPSGWKIYQSHRHIQTRSASAPYKFVDPCRNRHYKQRTPGTIWNSRSPQRSAAARIMPLRTCPQTPAIRLDYYHNWVIAHLGHYFRPVVWCSPWSKRTELHLKLGRRWGIFVIAIKSWAPLFMLMRSYGCKWEFVEIRSKCNIGMLRLWVMERFGGGGSFWSRRWGCCRVGACGLVFWVWILDFNLGFYVFIN